MVNVPQEILSWSPDRPTWQHITRVEGWLKMAEEAYEAALRQALEELTEVHQDAFSFV